MSNKQPAANRWFLVGSASILLSEIFVLQQQYIVQITLPEIVYAACSPIQRTVDSPRFNTNVTYSNIIISNSNVGLDFLLQQTSKTNRVELRK